MTVNTVSITSGPYVGNGVADTFNYTFRVVDKEQLSVFETDLDGNEVELQVDVDYTVNDVGDEAGGTIVRTAGALPSGYMWYVRSDYKPTQITAFASQGAFFPRVHEDAFDKLTFLVLQQQDSIGRSLSLSDSDPAGSGALNPVEITPETVVGFNAAGELVNIPFSTIGGVNPIDPVFTDFPYLPQGKTLAYWLERELVARSVIPQAKPSMVADFVNRRFFLDCEETAFSSLFDFTRQTTSLAFNTKGNLYSVAVDEPAYDHDPVTGKALGVRLDKQKTNLIENGEDFTVGTWVKAGVTANAAATTFFDGFLNASELVENSSPGVHEVSNPDASVNQTKELGGIIYIKRGVGNRNASVRFLGVNPVTDANYRVNIDLDDGSIINEVIGADVLQPYVSVRKCPDDIFEVRWAVDQLNATDDGDVSVIVSMLDGSNATYIGDGSSSIYVSGAGFYQDASPTNYVPASVGTQWQDRLRVVNPNFAKLFKDNCGTFVVRGRYATAPLISQDDRDIFNLSDGTVNNVIKSYNRSGGDIGAMRCISAQTGNLVQPGGAPASDDEFIIVVTIDNGFVLSWINGAQYALGGTDVSMDGLLNELSIGCNMFSTANMDGWIESFTAYPLGIPDADALAKSKPL